MTDPQEVHHTNLTHERGEAAKAKSGRITALEEREMILHLLDESAKGYRAISRYAPDAREVSEAMAVAVEGLAREIRDGTHPRGGELSDWLTTERERRRRDYADASLYPELRKGDEVKVVPSRVRGMRCALLGYEGIVEGKAEDKYRDEGRALPRPPSYHLKLWRVDPEDYFYCRVSADFLEVR